MLFMFTSVRGPFFLLSFVSRTQTLGGYWLNETHTTNIRFDQPRPARPMVDMSLCLYIIDNRMGPRLLIYIYIYIPKKGMFGAHLLGHQRFFRIYTRKVCETTQRIRCSASLLFSRTGDFGFSTQLELQRRYWKWYLILEKMYHTTTNLIIFQANNRRCRCATNYRVQQYNKYFIIEREQFIKKQLV